MKMIVGLGNVGKNYTETRHNIGWVVVDSFAYSQSVELTSKPKLKAMIAKATIADEEVLLVKPTTMMNKSGQAVQAIAHFYKVPPKNILVVYDELDIPFGTVKVKYSGSGSTHNGLNSVINQLGADFWRMRVGVDRQPREIKEPADFVLARFSKDEEAKLDDLIATTNQLLTEQINQFQTTSSSLQS